MFIGIAVEFQRLFPDLESLRHLNMKDTLGVAVPVMAGSKMSVGFPKYEAVSSFDA